MNEKDRLEYHAILNFVAEYNSTHKRQLRLAKVCEPPMPDAICSLNGKQIGVEVVHLYGSQTEAKLTLGKCRHSEIPESEHLARSVVPLDLRALASMNQRLMNKCNKSYEVSPVWLLIRNAFQLWGYREYRHHRRQIAMPDSHPFTQIWLLCDLNSWDSGILRLA